MTVVELRRAITGYQVSMALYVAATLGIADELAAGPRTSDALAEAAGADPDALYRLLRALASIGVFEEQAGQTFALTEDGQALRTDAPRSVRGQAAFIGRYHHWNTW